MIVVNLNKSYRQVLSGRMDMDDATLGAWTGVTDEAAVKYGDVVIGVYKERVVSAFDISSHERDGEGKIVFDGDESEEFASLVGRRSPVKPWVRGQARPIQYIDTAIVRNGDAEVIVEGEGDARTLRAVVAGYILSVDHEGHATVEPPEGGVVTVTAAGTNGLQLVLNR